MGSPRLQRATLEPLLSFATENEAKWIRACLRYGGARAAAKATGGKACLCFSALRTVRARAARFGFAPEHGWNPPAKRTAKANTLPEGFDLGARSDFVDLQTGEGKSAWLKSRQERGTPEPPPEGFVPRVVSQYTDGQGGLIGQWKRFQPGEEEHIKATLAAWERHAALYKGLAGAMTAPDESALDPDLVGVLPIGDPHIGLLSWAPETGDHQDTGIVCRELLCCVRQVIHDMPACPHIIIGNLGDALHSQDDSNKTPGHGNVLDVDGRFAKVLDAAHVAFRGIIDAARAKFSKVTFRNLPGNHDPRVAVELMMWLRAVYENEPRVEIADAFAAHQYDRFGVNLLGWHHGDRSKKAELPAIMASDHDGGGTGWWGETTEHVWHVGHEHHTTQLETPSCLVHVHNTLVGRDAYHAGRYRAKRMLEAYTYHKLWGLHTSNTVSLARVRAALAAEKGRARA